MDTHWFPQYWPLGSPRSRGMHLVRDSFATAHAAGGAREGERAEGSTLSVYNEPFRITPAIGHWSLHLGSTPWSEYFLRPFPQHSGVWDQVFNHNSGWTGHLSSPVCFVAILLIFTQRISGRFPLYDLHVEHLWSSWCVLWFKLQVTVVVKVKIFICLDFE